MKKLVLVSAMLFVAFGSYAYAAEEKVTKETTITTKEAPAKEKAEPGNNILQLMVGPMVNIKDWGPNQFFIGAAFGGKYMRLGLGYARASTTLGTMNSYRPFLLIDVPFTFGSFAIGPTLDIGPSFGFVGGQKVVDVMMIGFGLDIKWYFNNMVGIALSPIHFSNSFANYTTGGTGWTKGYKMSYDLLFSFILRF